MLSNTPSVILITIGFCLLIQCFYWWFIFRKLWILRPQNQNKFSETPKPFSVIVCAKNERENLATLLPILANQSAKISEIIIVDDFSTDATIEFLNDVKSTYKSLKIISNKKEGLGKKNALTKGIKEAENDLILLTDADCKPSIAWAETMQSKLKDKNIVLGYSPYEKKPGWLNLWIRYEAVLTAIQYLSAALWKEPYMGVGRNLMYYKELLEDKSLQRHNDLSSGDDDLWINQIANGENTSICIDPKGWVFSKPADTIQGYFAQKRRHFSTAHRYKWKHIIGLSLFSFSWVGFYVGLICLLIFNQFFLAIGLLVLRQAITLYPVCKLFDKLGYSDGKWYWPILDFVSFLYFLTFAIHLIPMKKQNW